MKILLQILLLIITTPAAIAKSSWEFYSRGRLSKASTAVQKEMPKAKEDEVEKLLDLSLDILAKSRQDRVHEVFKVYNLAHKKKLKPYLMQRIAHDLNVLQTWNLLKRMSVTEMMAKIEEAKAMPESALTANMQRRSLLRFYGQVALWHNYRKKDVRWMFASAKAQQALDKKKILILKEIRGLKKIPLDMRMDIERLLEEESYF